MNSLPNRGPRSALTVQHIDISRIEGIADPFRLADLSPGINLIHGPNAIGKSQTAAAIQAMIWPAEASPRSDILGHFAIDDDHWQVEVDGQRAKYRRDGLNANPPELGGIPSTHKDRYLLTLQELLHGGNKDFAQAIQREAAGGYDLNAVRVTRKLTSFPKPQPARLRRAHAEAAADTIRLQRSDLELQRQERSLEESKAELTTAIEAAHRVRLLEAAREHVDAVDRLHETQIARDGFEDPIGRMTGDEYARVQALLGELDIANQQRRQLDHEVAQADSELEGTGFLHERPSEQVLPDLRERLARLRERETMLRHARQEATSNLAQLDALRQRFGPNVTDAHIASLNANGVRELADLTRHYREAEATAQAEATLLAWLGTTDAPADLESLRQGSELLARRLRLGGSDIPTTPGRMIMWTLLGSALVIVLEAMLLALGVSPAYFALVLLVIPLLWIAFRKRTSPAAVEIETLRQDYAKLGLELAPEWTPEAIEPALVTIQADLASALLANEKAIRWQDLAGRRQEATDNRQSLEERRQAMLQKFGVAPGNADEATIRSIANDLDSWRTASDSLAKSRVIAGEIHHQCESLLADLSDILASHGATSMTDDIAAATAIEHLAERLGKAQRLRLEQGNRRRDIDERVQPMIEQRQRELLAIYAQSGVSPGDQVALRLVCDRVEPCRHAQRIVEQAEGAVATALARLITKPEYALKTREEIDFELIRAIDLSGRRDDIQKQISGVEAEIRQAKRQSNLEDAIAAENRTLDALGASRDRDYANAAGWQVIEFIQSRNRDINRPTVLRTAADLLSRFTAGAFRLELDESNPPEFRAVDTASRRSLKLNQLSSGTRVQLLIAVRLAFIEATEQGPQLPLLLDETLGNSDDVRANAIIAAAIEIARRGRQVVYFTAQQDEMAKWNAQLAEHTNVPACRIFDLAAIRGVAGSERPALLSWNKAVFIPEMVPDGVDHGAARTFLNVSPIDLWASHIDGVDLWYLIPEMETLVQLRALGIRQWGQYSLLRERTGLHGIGSGEIHDRIRARALVVETVRREWQHGRPRPLTKQHLRDCGLVSDARFDDVANLAGTLSWHPQSLIDALREKSISGFGPKRIDELDAHFRSHGFINEIGPLSDEVIRASVLSAAAEAIAHGIIDGNEVDSLLLSLGHDAD